VVSRNDGSIHGAAGGVPEWYPIPMEAGAVSSGSDHVYPPIPAPDYGQSSAQSYDDINSQPYSPISPTRRYRNSPLFASPATGQRGGGIDMDSMDMDSATSGWEEFGGLHNLDSGGSPYSQFKGNSQGSRQPSAFQML